MPLRLKKTETHNALVIERGLYTKRFLLIVDREKCRGCGVCETICHIGAISLVDREKTIVDGEEVAQASILNIDEHLCDHCGMCEAMCPFGAIEHTVNGEPVVCVQETESFPHYVREIKVNEERINPYLDRADELCPLNLISVEDGKLVIDEKSCPCCRHCEDRTEGAILVRPVFLGSIIIHQEKCPEGCKSCLDVCPVEALELSEDGNVHPLGRHCVYCEACLQVCPKPEEALIVTRTSVRHTPVKSGAWNKALEKLATSDAFDREIRRKRTSKVAEAMKRRNMGGEK
ncbi:4Fe-4S dicluster domain-containing protein [Candidatus Thorarchaeota archaeon]|nr:MAG: 4Fe-4S dicluster domain-containing protein [Candidatus Thorarchaeota archaeon]